MRERARRTGAAGFLATSLVLAACAGGLTIPGVDVAIPGCDAVPPIAAAEGLYRGAPIYVANEMPTDAVLAWAQAKPGFQAIWIDREHRGWVTVAFNGDVTARQTELAAAFPGEGVVAVSVEWTMAQLEALQQRVMRDGRPHVSGSGIRPNYGVVSIFAGVLTPATVATIQSKFGGQRVCLEGIDPDDVPPEGPQPQAGEGWRLVADEDETGGPYRTGIAVDAASMRALWNEIGLAGELPDVDFETEVVVWFGAVHGSSCPRLRLDDVVVEGGLLFAEITKFEFGGCTADAIGHAYVVAIERSKLPKGRFTIQLEGGERPSGVVAEELTIVDADLTVPGSTLPAGASLTPPPVVDEARVESGGWVEPDVEWRFRLSILCGIEWLGEVNGVTWRTDVPAGEGAFVPSEWQAAIEPDGTIDLGITLRVEPEPGIEAVAEDHTVNYRPSADAAPACG